MLSITITVESLPYAHRLHGYNGRCARVHGHNARVEVTIEADALDAQGFVMDFYILRALLARVLNRFDHALVVDTRDPLCAVMEGAGEHVERFHAPPTAEHLARYVFDGVAREMEASNPPGRPARVTRVVWREEPGFEAVVRS